MRIRESWGGIVAEWEDGRGRSKRMWFDETDGGRIVLCAYIVEEKVNGHRDFVDESTWNVPQNVRDALLDSGYNADTIYDTDGWEVL